MSQWKVEFYLAANGKSPVLEWLQTQDSKVQAKFARIFDLLQLNGTSVGQPYVKPVRGKLYEVRISQSKNIFRIIYFAYVGQRFVMLSGFQKKTQKTPQKELDLAEARMKAFLEREIE